MKLYDYTNIENLFLVGDIHGDFETLFFNIKKRLKNHNKKEDSTENVEEANANEELRGDEVNIRQQVRFVSSYLSKFKECYNDSVIIVAGDCGFGFNKPKYYENNLEPFNEILSLNNCHIIFVRGNHDDPSYFSEEKINISNIKTVPDYSVIKTKNLTTLCVGGAISVDRLWRKVQEARINKYSKKYKKKMYWENEQNVFDEDKLIEIYENGLRIDSVVTHTAPTFAFPKIDSVNMSWYKIDANLKDDVHTERENLDKIFKFLTEKQELKLKFWGYGHFHENHQDLKEDTLLIALDMYFRFINPIKTLEQYLAIRKAEEEEKKEKNKKLKFSFDEFLLNMSTEPYGRVVADGITEPIDMEMPHEELVPTEELVEALDNGNFDTREDLAENIQNGAYGNFGLRQNEPIDDTEDIFEDWLGDDDHPF